MTRAEVERILRENLSVPLPPEDVDDLMERLEYLWEQGERLRELPLLQVEPPLLPSLEETA